jgi:demethylmenaquinone methyltransferase/2-methoxy-6-polyprenyl-1,4-benzoquinol methylase
MFDAVAPRYDLLNRTLSMGIDRSWRRALARELREVSGPVLDLCTGTGDVMFSAAGARGDLAFVGLDFAPEMVKRGAAKAASDPAGSRVAFGVGDATALAVASGSVGAVTIAFGIRNVADVPRALEEAHRVLRPGGRIVVLEFSIPRSRPLRAAYLFYFRRVLPVVGGIVSGVREAYAYLPMSVERFPEGDAFLDLLARAGFISPRERRLSFGIASLYVAEKG